MAGGGDALRLVGAGALLGRGVSGASFGGVLATELRRTPRWRSSQNSSSTYFGDKEKYAISMLRPPAALATLGVRSSAREEPAFEHSKHEHRGWRPLRRSGRWQSPPEPHRRADGDQDLRRGYLWRLLNPRQHDPAELSRAAASHPPLP